MKLEFILYIYLIIQTLFLGPVLIFIINQFFKKFLIVKGYATGLIIPFFIFYAKDLEFKTSGYNKTDIVKVKIKKVFFWINPIFLLMGKVRVMNLLLLNPEVKYINRIPSSQKIKYMPGIGKVILKKANLKQGSISIEDRTVFPLYKVNVEEIELENSEIDLGVPLRLIFNSSYGYCKIETGSILTSCENKEGSLQVQGVTWGKLVNLDILPIGFLKNKIDLNLLFFHDKNKTSLDGSLGQINRDPFKQEAIVEPKKLEFKFQVDWSDYQLPFDLALKKMVYQLFVGLNYGGAFSLTVNLIAERISKLINKQ